MFYKISNKLETISYLYRNIQNYIFMKKLIVLLIIVIIGMAMAMTCPTVDEHRDAISEVCNDAITENENVLVSMFGGYLIKLVADELVVAKDYFVVSMGYIDTKEEESQLASIGVLGHVYVLFDKDDIKELLDSINK